MRDLFQVVFELKKKEIELARQHIQSKTIQERQPITLTIKSSALDSHVTYTKSHHEPSASKYVPGKEVIVLQRKYCYLLRLIYFMKNADVTGISC